MSKSYIVKLGVGLWLASMGITGGWASILSPFLCWAIGSMVDKGILVIDITIDAVQVGLEESEFKDLAAQAYNHAVARVYTDEEKNQIRQEYLDTLRKFGTFGDGVRN